MTTEVRLARPDEFAEAGAVTAEAYREFVRLGDSDWEEYLERIADVDGRAGRTEIVVAVEEGRVLGSATLELESRVEEEGRPLEADEAHIRMLGVHPDARRMGIARMIMGDCERRALEAGRHRISLHTTQRMTAAQAMYEALGFERKEDTVFPDGFVLLSYSKRLEAPST